jgi:hypothetical protein
MNTGSRLRKRLQSKGISQKSFLTNNHADDQYKKNWPSLKDNSLSCIRYVRQYCFPKNRIVLPRARPRKETHFQETHPTLLLQALCMPLSRIAVFVDFNKSLGYKIP